jgi:hypothetical protein
MQAARTLYEFDDAVTAPLHGFRDADDYWRAPAASPAGGIACRRWCSTRCNDPFLPAPGAARRAKPRPR